MPSTGGYAGDNICHNAHDPSSEYIIDVLNKYFMTAGEMLYSLIGEMDDIILRPDT